MPARAVAGALFDGAGAWLVVQAGCALPQRSQHVYFFLPACSVIVPAAVAALPPQLLSSRTRRTAVADFLTRSFGAAVAASGALPAGPALRMFCCALPWRAHPALCPASCSRAGGDIRRQSGGWQGEKGGEMSVDRPGE